MPEESNNINATLVEMKVRMGHIERTLETLVTRWEFTPVKLVVYGLVALLCSTIVAALVALVVRGGVR